MYVFKVTFDESFKEFGELASLFGFRNFSLSSSASYESKLKQWSRIGDFGSDAGISKQTYEVNK